MFEQGDYRYLQTGQAALKEYIIQPGDELSLSIYSRDGFKLIDVLAQQGNQTLQATQGVRFLVSKEGDLELPILNQFSAKGLTELQLEKKLEQEYARFFNDPYAVVRVLNRRCIIFKGTSSSVVSLNRAPTNLLEVIAKSGGLEENLKAYNIKIIRGDLDNPEIIEVDLSTIEGMSSADLIIQGNDIIYIERRLRVVSKLLREFTPVLTIISTLLASYALIRTVGGN